MSIPEIGQNVLIGLAQPFFPENIGAAARACAVMGFPSLSVISPHCDPFDPRAYTLASHAANTVLEPMRCFNHVSEWAALCDLRIGFCLRERSIGPLPLYLHELGPLIENKTFSQIGLLFGCEKSGLNNDELSYCHYICEIETSDLLHYHSLNLSQAVQIVTYVLRMHFLKSHSIEKALSSSIATPPSASAQKAFDRYLEEIVFSSKMQKFSQRTTTEQTLKRLRLLLQHAIHKQEDLDFLFGFLKGVSEHG